MPVSKSCLLKGNQKQFYLLQNEVASCCRAKPDILDKAKNLSDYIDQWKTESQLLDQGIEIDSCEYCWKHERKQQTSYRNITNQNSNNQDNVINLSLSNLCNQMCSYCGPKFSSTWQNNIDQLGMFKHISASNRQNLKMPDLALVEPDHWLSQLIDYMSTCADGSVSVTLLGGEPLMQQRNLEKLLSLHSKKIKNLIVTTNLNPPNDKFLRWLLSYKTQVANLKFMVSLDASPDHNHWPRAMFDKNKFLKNLQLIQDHDVQIEFQSVVSVLGIFDLAKFITWANQQKIKINFSTLYNPDCLDPTLIPADLRQQIWNSIQALNPSSILKDILCQSYQPNELKLVEQHSYLIQYFDRTDLNPEDCDNDLFKEYWTWLTKNYQRAYNNI